MKYRQTLKRQATRLAVLALLVCLASNGKLSLGDEPSPAFDFHKGALANGLKIVTVEDFSCPIVAVHLWYHVGSKNESPDRQGFAHMFEHMMFRGTDHLGPTDHFDFIHRVGGSCNAYTTFDQTVYVQTVPANQVELALWLEAERMSMLKIDQNSFDTERKVVEEERRMGLNRPYGTLMERVLPVLTPGHPYRWTPIGSIPHLRAASVAELRQFWTRYYVPNNATLVLVGAIHHERAEQLARKYFGWIPRYDDPPRVTPPDNKPFQRQQVTLKERNAPAPVVALLFRGIPLASDDDAALELMTTILGGGQSSRLYRRIVAQDQSAVFALAGAMSLEQSGVVGAGAVLKPIGGDPDKVLQALESEIQRIRREPVRDAELLKARNQLLKQLVQENLTVEGKARAVGTAAVLEGDVSRVTTRIDRIRKVTTADIQRVAKTYLDPDHAVTMRVERNLLGTLGSLLGMKASVEDAPITAKREEHAPPPGRPGAARPADYPSHPAVAKRLDFDTTVDIQSQTLANGLTVVVVENHEIPYVSATLGLLAGAWTESKPGTASTALQMLTKGTDRHSEEELARELETYAISLSGEALMDNSTVSMSCLPDQVGRAIGLMAEVVKSPTMPENEFKKLLAQARTGLAVQVKEPSYLADRQLRRQLYGDHPYARSAVGELEDLAALKRDDLAAWWDACARPDEATLIFAGDIDMARARKLADEHFGAWRAHGEAAHVELPAVPQPQKTHIYLVDYPGVQSQIRVGQIAFTRKDPAFFTSRVLSGYFGGAFSSRLNDTIRVKKGLTYGARGGFSAQRFSGKFAVSTFSKVATTAEAVRAIFDEIERLRNEPPSKKELDSAVSYTLGAFPATRETPQQLAGEVWLQRYADLPEDFFDQLLRGVASATAEECVELARARVSPNKMTVVVVGPASKLRADLAEIAPVTVVKP